VEKPENRGSIKLFNAKKKTKENKLGVAVRSMMVVVGGHRMYCYEGCQAVPARPSCKSVRRQSKVLGSKEGRLMGNGLFEYGVEAKNSSI
jgi:hypothetical protein